MRNNKHDETAKERAELFLTIYGEDKLSDILKQFESRYIEVKDSSLEQVQTLYRDYSYSIFYMYSPSAIRNNLVKFKNVIKKVGGKYKANAIEAFTIDNIYAPIKKRDMEIKTELKQELRDGISDSQNIDPLIIQKKVRELKEFIDKKKYDVKQNQDKRQVRTYYLLGLLGLATGRRFSEIIKTLEMKKRGTKLTFSGLLKGNNDTIEGNIIALSYIETNSYLKELRTLLNAIAKDKDSKTIEEMKIGEINSKYSRVFNNAMKRLDIATNVKALRHNYAIAGSQIFKKDNETIEETITRILGHREVFTSALNYS
jgi:hypothetical protein